MNDPVWFRDFVAHAAGHGLQFFGEAHGASRTGSTEEEQYRDFVAMRSFRQSLLCRADVSPESRRHTRADAALPIFDRDPQAVDSPSPPLSPTLSHCRCPFEELLPYDTDLAATLFALWERGAVDLHVFDFPCEETVTPRPRATQARALPGGALAVRHQCLPSPGGAQTPPTANSCSGWMAGARYRHRGSSGSREWAYWRGRDTR